jgi:hypothetical protein
LWCLQSPQLGSRARHDHISPQGEHRYKSAELREQSALIIRNKSPHDICLGIAYILRSNHRAAWDDRHRNNMSWAPV